MIRTAKSLLKEVQQLKKLAAKPWYLDPRPYKKEIESFLKNLARETKSEIYAEEFGVSESISDGEWMASLQFGMNYSFLDAGDMDGLYLDEQSSKYTGNIQIDLQNFRKFVLKTKPY